MAYQFSAIQVVSKSVVSPDIIVGGAPKSIEDLLPWVKAKECLLDTKEETLAVIVKTYLDGDGRVYPADSFVVAHIQNKIERFSSMGRDWLASIPKFVGTYTFEVVKECART